MPLPTSSSDHASSYRRWLSTFLPPVLIVASGLGVIVALGVAQRIGWFDGGTQAELAEQTSAVHTCPMHPQIRQPGPGSCPICGMPLVPAAADEAGGLHALSVKIEPAQRRLANIETAPVQRQPVSAVIRTVGAVAIDESRMATISSYTGGRLEKLFADYTGVEVATGDHLAVVYSPELYSAQVEYVESRGALQSTATTLAAVRQAHERLVTNARKKLVELGMQPAQIKSLETSGKAESRLTIFAPMGGTVIEKLAVEGKYIQVGEPIYRIADLSMVWLMLELYPEDAARIRYGQQVDAALSSLPGQLLGGRVGFIDRTVNVKKRTVGVRVEFLNPGGQLRPGDYANASIHIPLGQTGQVYDADLANKWISPMHPQIIRDAPGKCPVCGMDLVPTSRYGFSDEPVAQPASLFIPRSALLMAGKNSVVYVETEPGRFQIRSVSLGPILRDRVIVLDGLQEGEQVATAGNFLIDSQMQLAGKPSLIDPSRAIAAQKIRNKPLEFDHVHVSSVAGQAGVQLEALFAAYFQIQGDLAADKKPSATDAGQVYELARKLATAESLPPAARDQLVKVAKHSEHLHHLELNAARLEAFRPLSHAVLTLATLARGEAATTPFYQMFCPMVKGGAGDWLQSDPKLVNPYKGSQMLHCGSQVRQISNKGHSPPPTGKAGKSQGSGDASDIPIENAPSRAQGAAK